jgi:hypothetical protein
MRFLHIQTFLSGQIPVNVSVSGHSIQ